MLAVIAAALSVSAAALVALAGYSDAWILAAAVGLSVFALAAGWGPLFNLPDPVGTAVLIGGTGAAALAVAVLDRDQARPLAAFAPVLGCGVVAAFGHELLRRPALGPGGRPRVIESITGTISGQVLAVLAAGWLLLPQTRSGRTGVLVAAVAVAAARLATALPRRRGIAAWLSFVLGVAGATAVTLVIADASLATAATIGVAVAAVVTALEVLLAPAAGWRRSTGMLAAAAAPVAVAGTVAYAAVRLVVT